MIEVRPRSLGVGRTHARLSQALLGAPTLVSVLLLTAVAARILMGRHVLTPWVMVDELQYSELANSFAANGHYMFRERPHHLPSIYPALISPAWLADSMKTTYAVAKGFNAALMTAAAIPLYAWARRLVRPAYAILAVVFFLALPSFVYTAEILTENAYVPAVVLALFGLALALERATIPYQLLALALAALAVAVRVQGVVFVAIVPTAIGLKVLFDLRSAAPASRRAVLRELARWSLSLGLLVLAAAVYPAYEQLRGRSLSSALGTYNSIVHWHYTLQDSARWVSYHFGELAFSVGVIPFSALVLLVGLACTRAGTPRPVERAFVAVAAAGVFWTVVEAGVFASVQQFRIEERYMFNVVPVLLLALVVWLDRGLPRPPGLAAAAALLPVALFLTLPYATFFTIALDNSTFGLIPLERLGERLGGDQAGTQVVVAAGMLLAGLLFASVPREVARLAIPVVLLTFLTISTISVFGRVDVVSTHARHAGGLHGDPSWIDHAIGENARAEFLYTTAIDRDPHALWQTEFWNESVRRVFAVTSQDPSIPDVDTWVDPGTGRIIPILRRDSPDHAPRYAVSTHNVEVAGSRLERNGFLVLYRVSPPLRLASLATGIDADGWTGASAAYTRYSLPREGTHVEVRVNRHRVKGVAPAQVRVVVGPASLCRAAPNPEAWTHQVSTVEAGGEHLFRLPVRRAPFQVRLSVDPTFSPADYGSPDPRQLGVRVVFSVHRRRGESRAGGLRRVPPIGRPIQHCQGQARGGRIASTN